MLTDRVVQYLADIKRVLVDVNRLVYETDPLYVVHQWVSYSLSGLQTLAVFIVGGAILGSVLKTPEVSWPTVLAGVVAFAFYMGAKFAIDGWAGERGEIFYSLVQTNLQVKQQAHMASLDLGRQVDPAFQELVSMVEHRGMHSILSLWRSQIAFLGAVISLSAASIVLLSIDWVIGPLALIMAIPGILQRWILDEKRRVYDEKETLIRRQRRMVFLLTTSPERAVFTRLLRLTESFLNRYRTLSDTLMENVRALARMEFQWSLVSGAIAVFGILVIGLYFSAGLVDGKYSLEAVAAIFGSLLIATTSFREFGWQTTGIERERRDYGYLEKLFDTKPLVDESNCKPIVLAKVPEIMVDDISFTYPGQTSRVVDQCSFTIPAASKVAFVGPNGSSKTTILRLLSRVYVPDSGRVWADEYSLDSVTQESWLRHAVMITQAATPPGMEIFRALTGGELESVDMDRMGKALVFSGASSIVTTLPHGLRTWIGQEWPNGRGFSTGELQRFALAASFYRLLDPSVHVALFDEPTANCDSETKANFYSALTAEPEFAEKTVIVTLHDPLYLHYFERVIQFEKGRVTRDLRGLSQVADFKHQITDALARDL